MVSFEAAIENAERILQNAEGETDLRLVERLDALASTWIMLAGTLTDHRELS